jgi:hypothetical protein
LLTNTLRRNNSLSYKMFYIISNLNKLTLFLFKKHIIFYFHGIIYLHLRKKHLEVIESAFNFSDVFIKFSLSGENKHLKQLGYHI